MSPKPGEVWLADLGLAAKARPVIIISREDPNPPRVLFVYVPLTTQNRGSRYEVELGKLSFLTELSVANVQAIGSIPLPRLDRSQDRLPSTLLDVKNIFASAATSLTIVACGGELCGGFFSPSTMRGCCGSQTRGPFSDSHAAF